MKETLVLMCLASNYNIVESWKVIVGHRVIYYAKKLLKYFVCVEFRFPVAKWNIWENQIFPSSVVETC